MGGKCCYYALSACNVYVCPRIKLLRSIGQIPSQACND
jgi:hypothetical protein